MKRLIVNADDFGYTRGVNCGVIRGFNGGIITSATLMANGNAFDDAVQQARDNPTLGIGCHLMLVDGPCVELADKIPSLADSEGRLPVSVGVLTGKLMAGAVRGEDIARELRAQVTKVMDAGIKPTHFDSHKHTHFHPRVMEQMVRVAEEFGIRRMRKPFEDPGVLLKSAFRNGWSSMMQSAKALLAQTAAPQFDKLAEESGIRTPARLWGVAATGFLGRDALLSILASLPEGVNELMCHPGEYDEDLEKSQTRLKRERERELEALIDPEVRKELIAQDIELMNYRGLN